MYAPGEVAEWSNAPDLKSGELKGSVGSNPTLSVFEKMPNLWAIVILSDTPDFN